MRKFHGYSLHRCASAGARGHGRRAGIHSGHRRESLLYARHPSIRGIPFAGILYDLRYDISTVAAGANPWRIARTCEGRRVTRYTPCSRRARKISTVVDYLTDEEARRGHFSARPVATMIGASRAAGNAVAVSYGIEQLFVEQGSGKDHRATPGYAQWLAGSHGSRGGRQFRRQTRYPGFSLEQVGHRV